MPVGPGRCPDTVPKDCICAHFIGHAAISCRSACCFLGLLAACAGRQAGDAVAGQDGTGGGAPVQGPFDPLPRVSVRSGQSVHVAVSGGEPNLNADLQSMLTAYIQSERGLAPADAANAAGILVRVRIEDIYPLGSKNEPVSAGKALGSAATGAMLGMLLGSAVDLNGRSGAGWGAGGGALLGLGVAMLDSRGKSKVWACGPGWASVPTAVNPLRPTCARWPSAPRERTWAARTVCPPWRTS